MRRTFMLLFIALALVAGATVSATRPVGAATRHNCDSDSTDDHMSGGHMSDRDMGHRSSGANCPVVRGARVIRVTGDRFRFTPRELTMQAGEDVTIRLKSGDIAHDIFVRRVGHIVFTKAGQTARGGLRIDEPGTYRFWCTISGHKQAGMTGLITVR
jgi:plastocyanin